METKIIHKELVNKIESINVDNLPPVKNLIFFGKPVEQLSREQLIAALYIVVRRLRQMSTEVK